MARFSPEGMSGETGGTLEWGVFGDIDRTKVTQALVDMKLSTQEIEEFRNKGYLNYKNSIDLTKRIQKTTETHNPSNPEKVFVLDLQYFLEEILELESENIRFYSALKTPLDIMHGVDGFFEIDDISEDGEKKQPVVVTIDLTMKSGEGDKNPKANILIRMPEGAPEHDDKDHDSKIENIAKVIAEAYKKIKEGDRFYKNEITV